MTTEPTDLEDKPEIEGPFVPVTTDVTDLEDEPEEPVAPVTTEHTDLMMNPRPRGLSLQ